MTGARRVTVIICLALCIMTLLPYLLTSQGKIIATRYPLTGPIENYDAYIQQCDAFIKGQLYIDVEPSNDLLNLENPYERSQRDDNGIFYLWDRALYDGKYYSYFGIAPIITVYMPIYLLTGCLPYAVTVCTILAFVGMIGVYFALKSMLRYFGIDPPFYLFITALVCCEMCSLLPMLMSSADMYYVASTSAVCNLALFFAFFFTGMNCKPGIKRNILFVLASVAFVLIIMSRPGLCLFGIILIPSLFALFFGKELSVYKKISSFACLAIPLIFGALAVGIFNYLRFDSPFEFGAKYQLTVADVSTYKFTKELLIPCIVFYFFQMPVFKEKFPYISLDLYNVKTGVPYLYTTYTIGAFPFLSNIGILGISGVLAKPRKKHIVQKTTYVAAFVSVFLLAFADICMGGVNVRYFADISFTMILFTGLILLEIPAFFAGSKKPLRAITQAIVFMLFAASSILGFLLIFENERNYIMKALSAI